MFSTAKNLINKIRCHINPRKFFLKKGVKMNGRVYFYNKNPGLFSTEPWLITLGDNVYIGIRAQFLTHDMGTLLFPEKNFVICGNITVGNNVVIGMDAMIMPGVNIGSNVIIGARSVVTKSIPDNSVVAGVPARVIGSIKNYENKIDDIMNGKNNRYWSNLEKMHASKNNNTN